MQKWVATIILLAAAGLWGWRLMPSRAPGESALRQTVGMTAEVVAVRPDSRGVAVTCRVTNTTPRAAEQVVLRVMLVNAQGQTLAANPLASVANVAARESREAVFFIPIQEQPPNARAQVEISLVRWR